MSDDASRNLSSRVFHVDRECYVVYVGTTDHRFRPFLRLGTSEWLPDKVKRHISNVVITDHLTGNPQYEPNCLEKPVSHDMRYVGTTTLVNSVKQFVHDQNIASRPISPPKKEEEAEREGAHVLFYSDGNVRIIVDGREVLDLSKREKSDRHAVFEVRRLNELARSSGGSYFASSFARPGFFYLTDGTLLLFDTQTVELRRLAADGIDALSRRLLPPELITRVSGPVARGDFVDLCKWRLRQKAKLSVAVEDGAETESGSSEIDDLLTLLTKAGLKIDRANSLELPPPLSAIASELLPREGSLRIEDNPSAPSSPSLRLPEGAQWLSDEAPPLLPGVAYTLAAKGRTSLEGSERQTLHGLLSDAVKKEIPLEDSGPAEEALFETVRAQIKSAAGADGQEPSADALLLRLLLWNLTVERHWNKPGTGSFKGLAEEIARQWRSSLAHLPLPLSVTVHSSGEQIAVTFSLPQGFTKGRISENRRVADKIDAFIARRQEAAYYKDERGRLESFLSSLLEKQKVAPVSAPKAKPKEDGAQGEAEATEAKSDTADDRRAEAEAVARAAGNRGDRSDRGAPGSRKGEENEGKSPSKAILIAALAILLLGGAGALIYLTGGSDRLASGERTSQQEARETAASGTGEEVQESGDRSAEGDESSADDQGEPDASSTPPENETVAIGNGGFEVTVIDVILFVNRVARLNGYEPLGAVSPVGRDPDWIFPGNRLELPDGSVHLVQRGDTMWDISREFLLRYVDEHHRRFQELQQRAESGDAPIEALENLREEVYVESLREAITDFLESL